MTYYAGGSSNFNEKTGQYGTKATKPTTFNTSAYNAAANAHQQAGTQMTPDEYASYGGNVADYGKLYGDTAWYRPDGGYTTKHSSYGELAKQHEQAGTQMTPWEAAKYGISQPQYANLYGSTAWYNPDGSKTANAPAWLQPATNPQVTKTLFPAYEDPNYVNTAVKFNPNYKLLDTKVGNVPQANFEAIDKVPGYQDYLPESIESSPLYQYQLKQGLGDLDKYMAAKGLNISGANAEAAQRLVSQLTAEESERIAQRASDQANRAERIGIANLNTKGLYDTTNVNNSLSRLLTQAKISSDEAAKMNDYRYNTALQNALMQTEAKQRKQDWEWNNALAKNSYNAGNADKLWNMQQFGATRADNLQQNKWNNLFDTLGLLTAQNPMNIASAGTENLANLLMQAAAASRGGGGGGGGGTAMPAMPAPPSGPNYSALAPFLANADYANNVGGANILANFFGSMFG